MDSEIPQSGEGGSSEQATLRLLSQLLVSVETLGSRLVTQEQQVNDLIESMAAREDPEALRRNRRPEGVDPDPPELPQEPVGGVRVNDPGVGPDLMGTIRSEALEVRRGDGASTTPSLQPSAGASLHSDV